MDRCVVIGAGIAGISVAETLRDNGFAGSITVLGAEPHMPYERPPLAKEVLHTAADPRQHRLRAAEFYVARGIELRRGTTATRILPDRGIVELADGGRCRADRIVLAPGGRPRRPSMPGVELSGVHTLRTADDALAIRAAFQRREPIAVVGGGFIGTEVAAAAASLGCPVTVFETARLPMLGVLDADIAQRLMDAHRRRGVVFRTDVRPYEFTGTDRLTGVRLDTGEHLPAGVAVLGVGLDPDTALAREAGLAVGAGIRTDGQGRTSHPAVFAAGDAIEFPCPDGTYRRHEHWQHAIESGRSAARAMLGLPPLDLAVPWFWSDQFDINIQLAGRPSETDARTWRGDPDSERFSVVYHRDGAITGLAAVNRGKDVRPAIELMRRAVRLDGTALSDPDTDLKKLLKAAV